MAEYYRDFIFCSPLLPVQSLDSALDDGTVPPLLLRDQEDSPEERLAKKRDVDRLHHWLDRLHPRLSEVARLLMAGESQATIARRLHLTEAAISKRISRIRRQGLVELAVLRESPLLF